jgi:hypothetical protein
MSAADEKMDRAADKLQSLADNMETQGGMKSKLAQPLADDAEFLRKLKPSLIKARATGSAPTDQAPGAGTVAPTGPQLAKRPAPKTKSGAPRNGPNPWLVAGVALAVGIAVAKWIDWRGHAHPRN